MRSSSTAARCVSIESASRVVWTNSHRASLVALAARSVALTLYGWPPIGVDRLIHSVAPYNLGALFPIARIARWRYGYALMVKSVDYASRILVAVVVAAIAAPAVHDGARAQEVANAQRTYERPLSGDERVVPISRTPEGFTLGASKADISYQIRTRWVWIMRRSTSSGIHIGIPGRGGRSPADSRGGDAEGPRSLRFAKGRSSEAPRPA